MTVEQSIDQKKMANIIYQITETNTRGLIIHTYDSLQEAWNHFKLKKSSTKLSWKANDGTNYRFLLKMKSDLWLPRLEYYIHLLNKNYASSQLNEMFIIYEPLQYNESYNNLLFIKGKIIHININIKHRSFYFKTI